MSKGQYDTFVEQVGTPKGVCFAVFFFFLEVLHSRRERGKKNVNISLST